MATVIFTMLGVLSILTTAGILIVLKLEEDKKKWYENKRYKETE